jgi:hypothetical protein
MPELETSRKLDSNGWFEIQDNPISKVGVFPYLGSMIDADGKMGLDPDAIYKVYRSAAALSNQETIGADAHLMSPDEKGVGGVIGEKVYFDDGYLYGNIKLFSDSQAVDVDTDKPELSCGYRCKYRLESGVFGDAKYTVVQDEIRGNHLASISEGRMGPEVSVLDQKITFTIDSKDFKPMPKEVERTLDEIMELEEMELVDVVDALKAMHAGSKAEDDATEKADRDLAQDEEEDDDKKAEDEEEDDKKAEDEEEDDKKAEDMENDDDKKSGMDAADIKRVLSMDGQIKSLRRELREHKRSGMKVLLSDIRKRDKLYAQASEHIGAFDHAEKTLDEVASYACDKLGLKVPKGHEVTALDAYFLNRRPAGAFATDAILKPGSKSRESLIDKFFEGPTAN